MTRFVRRMAKNPAPAVRTLVLGLVLFHVMAPGRAWAYLDPITGSIVLQVLAAGFVAAMATFRRTRAWFGGLFRKRTADRES